MRKLLVFLVVLILLVVGVDVGGRLFAESKAAQAIGRQTGTTAPTVSIHGFSFLAQALPGKYSHITLTSSAIALGPIDGVAASAELYDVVLPLGDAINGDTKNLTAARADVVGTLPAATVAALFALAGTRISAGPNGAIRIGTTVSVAGQSIPVTADLVSSYSSGALHLNAKNITADGFTLPDVAQVSQDLSLDLPLKDLPFTVRTATLTAAGANLVLTAAAADLRLSSIN